MSSINRRGILAGGLATIFSIFTSAVFAADGPTLKPKQIGQVIVWRDKKYTAIKSGKKIIWDKGAPIPVTSSATPKASPTPSTIASVGAKPAAGPAGITEIKIATSPSLAEGETKIFMNKDKFGRGKPYILTRSSNGVVAFDNICTHEGCGVELEAKKLICKCHISYFDGLTGKAISGPANAPLKSYDVKEINGEIFVLDFPW